MYRTEIIQVTKPSKQTWLLATADSPEDVLSKVEYSKVWATGGNADCSSTGEGDGWAETKNLAHALDLGRVGWAKGRETMMRVLDDSNVVRRNIPHKSDALDVGGSYPVVPLAVAGDPCCMVTHGMESTKTKPVIKIVVNVAVSGAVTAATIMTRGGAILSWIDGLEAEGFRCEIDVIESGLFREADKPLGVLFSVKVKRASEPLDIDRVAFWICHPAIQRRIFFRCYEMESDQASLLGLSPMEAITYGAPTDAIPPEALGPISCYFPAMMRNSPDYASPASAVALVERVVLASLQIEDVEAFNRWGDE